MKNKLLKTLLAFLVIFFTAGKLQLSAQMGDIGLFFAAGLSDAEKLSKGYIAPFTNGFGANLSSGWFNSAKTHQLLGFSLTFTTSVAIIPTSARNFDVSALGLSGTIVNGINSSPTVAGKKNITTTRLRYLPTTPSPIEFNLPAGTGLGYVPAPMLSLGLGLIKDTEIKVRYIPKINIPGVEGELGLWGVGIKHGLKQWIPFLKRVPVLNVSLQGAYTQFGLGVGLNVTPASINAVNQTTAPVTFDNQKFEMTVHNYTANLIVSADLPIITFYGALGINSTNTNLKFLGYYPIPTLSTTLPVQTVVTNASVGNKDPLNIDITHVSGNPLQPRINAGFKLKLALITIHADYTYSDYSILTAGLGISFR